MRSGAQAADGNAPVVFLAQPGEGRLVLVALDIDTAADDRHRRPVRSGHLLALFLERGVDGAFDTVRGAHRLAVDAGETPAVGLVAEHAVGRAQRIERRCKGDHGEIGDQEEYKRSSDRMLYDVHRGTLTLQWREQDVAISIADIRKNLSCQLARVQRQDYICDMGRKWAIAVQPRSQHAAGLSRRAGCGRRKRKRRLGKTEAALESTSKRRQGAPLGSRYFRRRSRGARQPWRRSGRAWYWQGAGARARSSGSFHGERKGGQKAS
ncbi:hypothetical protein MESS4_680071 [Mesorhizobium sp. STM 4661]|nr:hypothetical protein MESS4_680071 [Mesorhizobium sp. STM 4661]